MLENSYHQLNEDEWAAYVAAKKAGYGAAYMRDWKRLKREAREQHKKRIDEAIAIICQPVYGQPESD